MGGGQARLRNWPAIKNEPLRGHSGSVTLFANARTLLAGAPASDTGIIYFSFPAGVTHASQSRVVHRFCIAVHLWRDRQAQSAVADLDDALQHNLSGL
jgi:hypothetical protein